MKPPKPPRFQIFLLLSLVTFTPASNLSAGKTRERAKMSLRIETKDIGIMGTGSNMFRTGIAHSSGVVFVGTYGPPPAIVWKYDPRTQKLTEVGAPGEYQLDSMVEAPNGKIYIGTAYNGLVYELDPRTGSIKSLGSPPVDSTPWIFTMICTRDGEIYGAKGVGLFHLDWRTGKMESCGIVPGSHATPGPNSSSPIIRTLEERPDGILWGDTNRWIFTFDPKTGKITPVADVAAMEDACYAVIHALGSAPVSDLYFQVYSRFSGKIPRRMFYVCRAATGKIEPLNIEGLAGNCWVNGWWMDGNKPRWLVSHYEPKTAVSALAVIDVENQKVINRWKVDGIDTPPNRIAGPGLWFISSARGTLYQAIPHQKRLRALATNPVPVECRCLAASPKGYLGTDTYDCGFAFTRDLKTGQSFDHGRVWLDDHRCNYGPAAFAGQDSRYFLANHGEAMPKLWATDIKTGLHWQVGDSVIQLVRFRDGTVWGTQGPNPASIHFDPQQCWISAWASKAGILFRYRPGAKEVETFPEAGPVGPIAQAPDRKGCLFLGTGETLRLYDPAKRQVISERRFPAAIVAATADFRHRTVYIVLSEGSLLSCSDAKEGSIITSRRGSDFGPADRGCFVLPQSGWLVGIASDGTVSIFDHEKGTVNKIKGPPPLPAGPAVDPDENAWYFADRKVVRYSVASSDG